LQAHLKTATSSGNISHKVNGIPALQWLEVWIWFSHLSRFASQHCFLSCTDETHQMSVNSTNSVRVGSCLIVSLSMIRYILTQGEYSIGFLLRQC
jgi:hypothetical protein